jgi:hypothetical protein
MSSICPWDFHLADLSSALSNVSVAITSRLSNVTRAVATARWNAFSAFAVKINQPTTTRY